MKSFPSLHISIATSGAAGGTAQADQHLPHSRSPQISSRFSLPRECGPRTQASAISLPNSLSTALPAAVTLSLHLLPKPHACSSGAADVLKQGFLSSRPLLLSSLSLTHIVCTVLVCRCPPGLPRLVWFHSPTPLLLPALYFQLCLSWCPDLTELPTVSIVVCTNRSK